MTWNASRLLSSGRELALTNLLVSSSVDIATVTECEMPETANDFAVAGYTTFHPLVPKGKSKTRVIILVKNGLVTSANVHVCPDLMDSQIQSVWLQFGPVSSMGGFTLCGVYRTWSDHDGRVFTAPEAAERLDILSGQISRAAERHARVVVHGDLNLDLD
jgi:exonuclease III